MLIKMYSLFDKKARFFEKPFYTTNDETAIRMVKNAFDHPEQQNNPFVINPEDFALFTLGS